MKRSVLSILWMAILITAACRGGGEAAEAPSEPIAVEAPKEEVFYTLSVDIYPEEGGLVYPLEAEAPEGDTIEVEAIPVPGYEFEGWSGASSLSSPNLSLTMDGDKQLTAHFKLKRTPTPEATLTPTPAPFKTGSEVTEEDVDQEIMVCGIATNFGIVQTGGQTTPDWRDNKYYSYIKLDEQFLIASFDWVFESGWVGAGLCIEDIVELLRGFPALIVDMEEGIAGVECTKEGVQCGWTGDNGNIPVYCKQTRCPAGEYFQPWEISQEGHFDFPDLLDMDTRRMQIQAGLAPGP